MMRNDGSETNSGPEVPSGSRARVEGEGTLSIPLSDVRLDIPFAPENLSTSQEPVPTGAVPAAGEPPVSPGRATRSVRAGRPVSTDLATARLTLPLRARLWLLFAGFVLLFVLVFGFCGWLLSGLTGQGRVSLESQVRLERARQLQMGAAGEKGAIAGLLAVNTPPGASPGPVSDFEFLYYQITFENNLFLLRQAPDHAVIQAALAELEWRHANLAANYSQIISDLKNGNPELALSHWQQSQALVEDLTARTQAFSAGQSAIAEEAALAIRQKQDETFLWLGLVAGTGGLLMLLLIWVANRFVIRPMGRLNIKLGQLLYGQTARITDRLNLLEHEMDSQHEKVAAARHDLKLPLTNIRNTAELSLILHEGRLPGDVRESLGEIIETSDASAGLINSLLARPDNRLRLSRVDLLLLVQRVVELVDLRDYKVHLRVELDEAVMDEQLVEHLLLNLLSNARKFSAGGIGIGTRLHETPRPGQQETGCEAELWVWNDGEVIPAGEREKIFRPGGQLAAGRMAGGHGLGLAIVKSIVERHSGRVVVESHEKVGTTFRIFLPYARQVPV